MSSNVDVFVSDAATVISVDGQRLAFSSTSAPIIRDRLNELFPVIAVKPAVKEKAVAKK